MFHKMSGIKKFYGSEKREGVSRYSAKNVRLTLPKGFVQEHFGVAEILHYRKVSRMKEKPSVTVLSHSAENICRGTL